jgi:hypothetical protein
MEYINAHNAEEMLMMEIKTYAHIASINIDLIVKTVNYTILAFLKRFVILADISLNR